jgi:muconolactone delta-isomerase
MQVIALVRRRTEAFSSAEFDKYLEAEAEAVRTFYIQGSVRAIWSRDDALGAVLLLEASSLAEAQKLLAALPLVQREMAEVEKVVPLRGYRGFGPRQT